MNSKLIEELGLDLQPVRKLTPLSRRLFQWLGLSLLWSLAFLFLHGLRADFSVKVTQPGYYLEMGLPLVLSIVAAVFALQLRTPVLLSRTKPHLVLFGLALCVLAFALQSYLSGEMESAGMVLRREAVCFASTVILNLLPGFVLYRQLKEGNSTAPQTSGFFASAASALWAAGVLPLACPGDAALHLLIGHILPVALILGLMWQQGRRLFSW